MESAPDTSLNPFFELFTAGKITQLTVAVIVFMLGFFLSRVAKTGIQKLTRHLSPQQSMIAGRTASVLVLVITFVVALKQAGIEISVALGAFGIFTVAIGFAAQTSASNLISGLFLMGEKPFVIGDDIQIGDTIGTVISIDLLSAKLRTGDHLLVRIPNETLLRSEITNLSRFSQRRLDIELNLPYKTDVEKVEQLLLPLAEANENADKTPAPALVYTGFADFAVKVRFSVWTSPAKYGDLKAQLLAGISHALENEGISLASPQRTLAIAAPLEVKLVDDRPPGEPARRPPQAPAEALQPEAGPTEAGPTETSPRA